MVEAVTGRINPLLYQKPIDGNEKKQVVFPLQPGVESVQPSGQVLAGPEVNFGTYTFPGVGPRPVYTSVNVTDGDKISTGAYAYGGGTILPGDQTAGSVNRTAGDLYKDGKEHHYTMTYYA